MIGHVLVVEPLSTNRIVMKARLASAHYGVTCCETLEAAILDVHDAQPDFVFFDANMGLPALAKLRLSLNETMDGANVPIVAVGNGSEGHLLSDVLNHGGQDLMQWPIDPELMQARLRSLMRQMRSLKNLRLRSLGIPSTVGDLANITPPQPITVVARTPARAATWAGRIRVHLPHHQVLSSSYAGILDPRLNAADGSTYMLVSDPASEPEDILHILSTLKTRSNGAAALYLTAFPSGANQQAAAALDMGAADSVFTDQHQGEIATRLANVAQRGCEISGLNAVLEDGLRLALIDPLTGLHNRRFSDHTLTQMAGVSQATKEPMAVMIFDVDHFKQVNDRFGHITGDRVLTRLATTLRTHFENKGLLARIGGEEFLAAIPATNAQDAVTVANCVRRAVEQMEFTGRAGEKPFKVTLSVGISISDGTGSPVTMIEDADEALYRAKSDGRNRARLSRTRVAA